LVYSKSGEEHLNHLKAVFNRFRENKLKINLEKCTFLSEEVEVLSKNGLKPIDKKVKAIQN